ncbi:hypothetical protein KFE25_012181 [Diacronema lutheri]|nr:hypothetical protein KFE25_012181 [Diacronema lutheri]
MLSDEHVAALHHEGFAVVDDFLDQALARSLVSEMRARHTAFRPHRWIFAGLKLPKPGVYELDMHDAGARDVLPAFHAFWSEHVPEIVTRVCARVGCAPPAGDAISVKAQRNDGRGGSFALHHDNPGPPSKRVLTLVVYLNDAWQPGHGGEIVFAPFAAPRVAVAPVFNRAVVFHSELALHGVLPARAERFCFSIWVDDPAANQPDACNLTRAHLRAGAHHDGSANGLAAFFRRSPLQRSIARAVYMEEMSRDLGRCLRAAGEDALDEATVAAVVRAHEAAATAQRESAELRDALALLVRAKEAARGAAQERERGVASGAVDDFELFIGAGGGAPEARTG